MSPFIPSIHHPLPVRRTVAGTRALLTALLVACAVMVCGNSLAVAETGGGSPDNPVRIEDLGPAPDFTLTSYSGERVSLRQYLGHGPLVIDFWATWCAPCRKALPHLQDMYRRYREHGLTVLTISTDDPRNQPKIGPFLRSQKLALPVLLDADSRVARLYRVTTVPATFLISAEGRIVALHRGYRDGDQKILERQIVSLLAETSPAREVQ